MKKLLILGALALAGCTTELGKFTVYSPKPLDLTGGLYEVDRTAKVKGVDEASLYLVFPSNIPQYDQAVQKAMAKRPRCVGLADMTLQRKAFWLLFGYCDFEAEGYPIIKKEVK